MDSPLGSQFGFNMDEGTLDPLAFEAPDFLADEDNLGFGGVQADPAITLAGEDLERFIFRLSQALGNAKEQMAGIHEQARISRRIHQTIERRQDYPGQPNLTTPIASNKAEGFLAHIVDAIEQRPLAAFSPEGVGKPAEQAARAAPICAAYLEREINHSGSRERLLRELPRETTVIGTGIARLGMVQAPSGEWFSQVSEVIPLERFYVDRVRVDNLKHIFSAYEDAYPFYQLQDMAQAGLLDVDETEKLRHGVDYQEPGVTEIELDFEQRQSGYAEETNIRTIFTCYMRFRPQGSTTTELYEAIWNEQYRVLLAVRPNPVGKAFDHPPLGLSRIGKQAGYLFGRGIITRLAAIQRMADEAVNNHLAINALAASPPFQYRQSSPFGKLMSEKRRLVPGVGIPTMGAPDKGDVSIMRFENPGLSLQDISVAQSFADKATFTEEAIGSSSDPRKTLGQFRVEVERGVRRVRLDLGDFSYDASEILTMLWAMTLKYKIVPAGIVEVGEGGKYLGGREIGEEEITDLMDRIIMPLFAQGAIDVNDLEEFEREFNSRLTDNTVPSARRGDLTISLAGTKVIADQATQQEMLVALTPYILQGLQLAAQDTYFNYHLRTLVESMGFKDVDKRVPPDPGVVVPDEQRTQLSAPLADTIARSSNMA